MKVAFESINEYVLDGVNLYDKVGLLCWKQRLETTTATYAAQWK